MVEIACECDDAPGVPHSHIINGDVRPWVDWKAVARALASTGETT